MTFPIVLPPPRTSFSLGAGVGGSLAHAGSPSMASGLSLGRVRVGMTCGHPLPVTTRKMQGEEQRPPGGRGPSFPFGGAPHKEKEGSPEVPRHEEERDRQPGPLHPSLVPERLLRHVAVPHEN